jgi:transcription antitermination factor NusG
MRSLEPTYPWFALATKPNLEKVSVAALNSKGLEAYVPLCRVRRRWSDRVKEVDVPLFPLYAFCRFDPQHRVPVLSTPGVLSIVGFGRVPVSVGDAELAAVRKIVESGLPVEAWPFVKVGHRILIEEGPLAGVEGTVLALKNSYRLIASITLLQRSISVELDRDWVRPIGHPQLPLTA